MCAMEKQNTERLGSLNERAEFKYNVVQTKYSAFLEKMITFNII